ncbi:MAG: MFS transporter [Acidimicrobiales bacterium]|nr:MFS transporter [Acidimicrobiales bacterium]
MTTADNTDSDPDSATTAEAAPSGTAPSGTFAALAIPRFRLLWTSGAIAFLAVGMQMTARAWLAIELTDSNSAYAVVILAFGVGMLFSIPFGGVAADRFAKRTVVVCAHMGLTVSSLWLGAMALAGLEAYWMLVVVSAMHGVSFAFMGPARVAFTGEIVPRAVLPNAVSLTQLTVAATQIVGPSLAGFLIAAPGMGTAGVYLITGGLTLVSIVPVLRLPAGRSTRTDHRSPLAELGDGLRYVRADRELAIVVGSTVFLVLVAMPYATFLPKVAEELFDVGPGWIGVLYGANSVGGAIATLYTARVSSADRVRQLRILCGYTMASGIALLAVTPNALVALPVLVFLGGGALAFQALNSSTALMLSEPAYHGRIQSLIMVAFSGSSLASTPLGALADAIGLRQMHLFMAVAAGVVVTAAMVLERSGGRQQALT